MKDFLKKRRYAFLSAVTILALMVVDTIVTSEVSTRRVLALTLGDAYALFEGGLALLILATTIIFVLFNKSTWVRYILIAYNALLTVALIDEVRALMVALPRQTEGYAILFDAFLIWLTNLVIFALWYWVLDGGGSEKRSVSDSKPQYDLMFPQEQLDIPGWKNWHPNFVDYLFLSFYSSMAFSPTDTLVLSRKMKFLLMLQALISVVVLAMIGARAINLLG